MTKHSFEWEIETQPPDKYTLNCTIHNINDSIVMKYYKMATSKTAKNRGYDTVMLKDAVLGDRFIMPNIFGSYNSIQTTIKRNLNAVHDEVLRDGKKLIHEKLYCVVYIKDPENKTWRIELKLMGDYIEL